MIVNNDDDQIYYFLIGNVKTDKEIGSYFDNTSTFNTINDFNEIVTTSKELFHSPANKFKRNQKQKMSLQNHNLYFYTTPKDTFYLAALRKSSKYCLNENLIFELMQDIDLQGIKKLVDKNGELTNIGKQNLKFCIEKYKESNKDRMESSDCLIEQFTVIEPPNKINNINTQLNEIKNEMTQSVQNIVGNMNDMENIEVKSEKIKNTSEEFKKDAIKLERRLKWQKYKVKIIIGIVLLLITIIIICIFI